MKIKEIMATRILTVPEESTVQEAASLMSEYAVSSLVVTNVLGSYVGIITERDLARRVVALGRPAASTAIRDVMSTTLYTIDGEANLTDAAKIMEEKNIRRLLITIRGKIKGIVSNRQLLKNIRYELAENLLSAGKEYIRDTY
ncbi:MAG TPA: CBS domain-containing protein [Candidatus Nanoarchaeia archaeon]|nr:CBS domain-containing protein [Candidatus Nanoarchaeia archaeon]